MAALLALSGQPVALARSELISAAQAGAGADLLTLDPSSAQFRGLTQGFNRRWTAPNAAIIYVPLTEDGAEAALGTVLASGYGQNFRVRGGGHCYEDFVYNAGTQALIDVSLLNQIGQDDANGAYFAQAGGTNWDLYRGLYWRYGKTLPAGSCYSVGLGGHVCGGGYGLMSRAFGLTVDWLSGVRVVTIDAGGTPKLRRVTPGSANPDDVLLHWAHTGGGGGNFGLITRYEFAALPDAPQNAELIVLAWNWTDIVAGGGASYLGGIIHYFQNFTRTAGDNVFGLLKLTHQSAGQVKLVIQAAYDGPIGSSPVAAQVPGQLARHGVGDVAQPIGALIGHPVSMPSAPAYVDYRWWQAVQDLNGSGDNQKGKYKSAYMRADFPDDQVQTIYKYLTQNRTDSSGNAVDLSSSLLQVDTYGGQVNRVAPTATAVWQRDSRYKLQYQTYWQDQAEGPSPNGGNHLAWIRDFYGEMYRAYGGVPDPQKDPSNNVDGCYVNYPDVDLNDHGLETALRLYYGGNLARLSQAKAVWDPHDYFHHQQSIPGPGPSK
jgi:FAD/FMN-containing dehydrogenase